MKRPGRLALAAIVLGSALQAAALAVPRPAFACSCVGPQPLAEYAKDENVVVLAGLIGRVDAQGQAPFQVGRVYHGRGVPAVLPIQGGDGAMCGIQLVSGEQVIFVASMFEGSLHPSSCSPFASLANPEGQRLAAEADAAFGGAGVPLPGATPLPVAAPAPAADVALLVIVGGLALGTVGLFGLVFLVARRNRRTT